MLKNYTLLLLCLVLAVFAAAQQTIHVPLVEKSLGTAPVVAPVYPYEVLTPNLPDPHPLTQSGVHYRNPEEVAGLTRWDAQSYGCMSQRIYANPAGEPVANWLFGLADPNFADRGTGHNVRSGGSWPAVNQRVEATRTGFPAASILGDGTEIIISHNTSVTPFKLWMARKAAGASTWTESALPNPPGIRMLWPKLAVGGPNNQTIHVIGITAPVGTSTGGVIYEGLNGHILYYRSTDGGLTWDKQNVIIPGLDSSRYNGFSADSYTIDASGNGVAIAVFPSWNDVRVYKSGNNGETWTDLQVQDFADALENYQPLPGVTYDSTDVPLDTLAPTNMAALTSDGYGAVLIDQQQEVHVWFGRMYVVDDNFADSLSSYYPTTNGLFYWKESRGANNLEIITGALDYDNNGSLNITALADVARYGGGNISSFPMVGTDAAGNMFLAYSALDERYRTGIEEGVFYRHLYMMKSTDYGDHWGDPLELTAPPYAEAEFVPFYECVYPAVQRHIDDQVWVLYQQDFLPGSNVFGNAHDSQDNNIVWVAVNKDDVPQALVGASEATKTALAVSLLPNPATNVAYVSIQLSGTTPAHLEVFDLLGRLVQQQTLDQVAGRQSIALPIQQLRAGAYWVRVTEGAHAGLAKLLVR